MRSRLATVLAVLAMAVVAVAAPGSATARPAEPGGEVVALAGPYWWANVAGTNAAGSRRVLDITGLSMDDGAVAQLWGYTGGNNQRFYLDPVGSSVWKFRAVHSGKCLDLVGPSSANGTRVHQWSCYSASNQNWRQESQGTRFVEGQQRTVYRFVNQYAHKCLDNAGGSGAEGNKIQIWECNGSNNQLWY